MSRALTPNPWQSLRQFTSARIALGRAGGSAPTTEVLDFQLAHARARDAVHLAFDADGIEAALTAAGLASVRVHSRAADRGQYLQRPDLGRRLSADSRMALGVYAGQHDAVFVIADGLSALAVHAHAVAVLRLTHQALATEGWRIAPVVIASQSRVALGDEIGEVLGAPQTAILIGERPGLSAADSLGIYLTYGPRVGRVDAERNCLSNIRPEGLSYEDASAQLIRLMLAARRAGQTGVGLKVEP
jgi:ethanolamine ammonia-lyase small subunit